MVNIINISYCYNVTVCISFDFFNKYYDNNYFLFFLTHLNDSNNNNNNYCYYLTINLQA